MCRPQCVLVLVVLYVGLVHCLSWDFATTSGNNLDFYYNELNTHSENITSGHVDLFTYDEVGNRMFFVESEYTNTAIYSYDMTTKKTEPLVLRKEAFRQTFAGLTFDPIEEVLFWIEVDTSSIYWFSLKPGSENNVTGNLLIKMSGRSPKAIAVDSCRGFIYWTSTDENSFILPSLIERARFDGTEREVVIDTNLQKPQHLVIDQQTQKLYWTVGTIGTTTSKYSQFSIRSSDLDGKNISMLYRETGINQPKSLAVSKDSIYWVHYFQRTVSQLPKSPSIHPIPKEIPLRGWYRIVTNYKIDYQIQGIPDCEPLKKLLPNNLVTDKYPLIMPTDVSLFCVHGTKVSGESHCECTRGFIGARRDVSVCQNYCFQGHCSISAEGKPKCSCNVNYSGERCEVNICKRYCLNDGVCSLNEESEPVCLCKGGYEGDRCDVSSCLKRLNKRLQTVAMLRDILNAGATPGTPNKREISTCAATIL